MVGIVAEYDPFHRGHAWQLAEAKRLSGERHALVVMSTVFTQRGMPALFHPDARVRAALHCGADAVAALPVLWALRDAEHFAEAGVRLLALAGCEAISFGAEHPDAALLTDVADMLESGAADAPLREALAEGIPYPQALCQAAERCLPGAGTVLSQPNDTLGVCYLRAIRRLGLSMKVCPVARLGEHHGQELGPYASASALRSAVLQGGWEGAAASLPWPEELRAPLHRPEALDTALLYRLRTMEDDDWKRLPGCSEGVEDRLRQAARQTTSREDLLQVAKTRRYPYARLNRLCAHALLHMEEADTREIPDALWLLGFQRDAEEMIAHISDSCPTQTSLHRLPPARWRAVEERAWDTWALGAGLPAGGADTRRTVVV